MTGQGSACSPGWGLYVHVPYCAARCPYCDFNVVVVQQPPWERFTAALLAELRAHAAGRFAGMPPLQSIYFGGGTPSLMPVAQLARVIQAARASCGLLPGAEITVEVNPEGQRTQDFVALRQAGVSRLSIGWQSTHPALLRLLGRRHTAQQGMEVVAAARAAGMDAVSLDLIFAVPTQSRADCAADVRALLALDAPHVSLYALTYHPGTPLQRARARRRLQAASEDLELQMMDDIEATLCAAGYEHYEVSNYAKPGFRARHNSLYWQGGEYLGLGPGAHSFKRQGWATASRWENVRRPSAYIAGWQAAPAAPAAALPPHCAWSEELSAGQLFAERLLCGLRQPDGVNLEEPILSTHAARLRAGMAAATAKGWATVRRGHLCPTARGLRHADALAEIFF